MLGTLQSQRLGCDPGVGGTAVVVPYVGRLAAATKSQQHHGIRRLVPPLEKAARQPSHLRSS